MVACRPGVSIQCHQEPLIDKDQGPSVVSKRYPLSRTMVNPPIQRQKGPSTSLTIYPSRIVKRASAFLSLPVGRGSAPASRYLPAGIYLRWLPQVRNAKQYPWCGCPRNSTEIVYSTRRVGKDLSLLPKSRPSRIRFPLSAKDQPLGPRRHLG